MRRAQTLRQQTGARPSSGERAGRGWSPGAPPAAAHRWDGSPGGKRQKRSPAWPGHPCRRPGMAGSPTRVPTHTSGGPDALLRDGECGEDARGAASPASGPAAGPQRGTPPRRGEQPRAAVSSHHTSLLALLGARQSYLIPSTASPDGSSSI